MNYLRVSIIQRLFISMLVLILICSSIQPVYATTLSLEEQANILLLQQQQHQKENSAIIQVLSIQDSVDTLKSAIEQDNLVIQQHKKAIESLDSEQQQLANQQKQDTETLGKYLRDQYTEGDTPYFKYVNWLISSPSIGDLIDRSSYVDTILSFYKDLRIKVATNSDVIKLKQSTEQDETKKLTDRVQSNQQLLDGLSVALAKQTSLITSLTPAELKAIQTQSRGLKNTSETQRLIAAEQLQAQPDALAKYLQLLASQPASANLPGTSSAPVKLKGQIGELLSFASTFLGVPYTWGGTYPQFDCSSYVQYVYGHFGITLNRVTTGQYGQGQSVSRDKLASGDLVFFSTYEPGPSHVGIYVGNGIMIDSSNSGVSYASINSEYWSSRYYGARRVIAQ
jgi:cell wall-associated NlpC family hydrolase